MEYIDLVYSQETGGNIDDNILVSNAFDMPTGAAFVRTNWNELPNAEKGDERHPEHNFLRVGWAGTFLIGGANMFQSWSEEDNVTANWFTAHEAVVAEVLYGHGSFTYTDVDIEARTSSARVVSSTTKTYWAAYPYKYLPDIANLRIELDEGASVLCTTICAEDWDTWSVQERDVLTGTTETIESPAIGKPVYITFSADCVVNGNAVGRGDTLKLTSSSFEIAADTNTKLIANFNRGTMVA